MANRDSLDDTEQLLLNSKTIAVVGLSPRADRPSYRVAQYLQAQGYRVIPVNPNAREVLGEPSYPSLLAVPEAIDLVDIFRRPEHVLPIVEEAIAVGAKIIWMQDGVINEDAAAVARRAGLAVVMDNCTMRVHQKLVASGKLVPSKH